MGCASTAACAAQSPTFATSTRGSGASASATEARTRTQNRSGARSRGSRTGWGSASRSSCPMSARRPTSCARSWRLPADSATRSRGSDCFGHSPTNARPLTPALRGGELPTWWGAQGRRVFVPLHPPSFLQAQMRLLRLQRLCRDGPPDARLRRRPRARAGRRARAARLLRFIRGTFDIAPDAEITLEANPASTDESRVAAWLEGGVNRLSLGVQGFEPRALAVLERKTDAAQATRAFRLARSMGVKNLSIDLIYAVPHQSRESWVETLRRALALGPDHVSTYCLTFEEGTLLWRRRAEGKLPELDPDLQWDQLDSACAELEGAGFRRYEVSNWAKPAYESRHNLAYWRCKPVYGAGAGAHSYATDGTRAWRWWNVAKPREYIAACPTPRADGEELAQRKAGAEALMLGLRTAEGLAPPEGFDTELARLASDGLIQRTDGRVIPTRRGMDLHNQIALAVL